jgi:hypothetical protein
MRQIVCGVEWRRERERETAKQNKKRNVVPFKILEMNGGGTGS